MENFETFVEKRDSLVKIVNNPIQNGIKATVKNIMLNLKI